MKTLGIIGGLGPESTIDYYGRIIALYRERTGDGSYPQFIINSINMKKGLDFMDANNFAGMAGYLLDEIGKLALAGATFALISANTPHIVFDEVASKSPIPLISIVEATVAAAKDRQYNRLALFGTRFSMNGDFYAKPLHREQIELVRPAVADQDYLHNEDRYELI